MAIISGTTRQTRLYRHLGFQSFAPLVGTEEAAFQPMYITFERFLAEAPRIVTDAEPMSFLPGPVPIAPDVRAAFNKPPQYHRDAEFQQAFCRTKSRLCRLTGSARVEILLGSGTLANDAVAAQLSLRRDAGRRAEQRRVRRPADRSRAAPSACRTSALEIGWGTRAGSGGGGRRGAAIGREVAVGGGQRNVDRHAERSGGAEDVCAAAPPGFVPGLRERHRCGAA